MYLRGGRNARQNDRILTKSSEEQQEFYQPLLRFRVFWFFDGNSFS